MNFKMFSFFFFYSIVEAFVVICILDFLLAYPRIVEPSEIPLWAGTVKIFPINMDKY